MGVNLRLQTEKGEVLAELIDSTGLVAQGLPSDIDNTYACLQFVDLYGDTVFNRLQIPHLIKDLERVVSESRNEQVQAHYTQMKILSERGNLKPHLYIKFIGD